MTPELSIVIPSHARFDLLQLCLESVTRFAPARTQVIVVDDGSKNGIVSKTAESFLNVEVIRHAKSRGFCAAANAGIAIAKAPIIEMLNDDTEVTTNWYIEAMDHFADCRDAEALRSGARVAAVAPLVLHRHTNTIDSAGDDYDPGGFATKRRHLSCACEVGSVSACAAFYRRDALLAVGGFPESFGAYFDDVDLSQRLRRAGYTLRFEPSSIVYHRGGASHKPSRRLLEQQSRNEEWLYWRNAESYATLPRHLAVLTGKALRRFEEGNLGPWLTGRLRAAFQ